MTNRGTPTPDRPEAGRYEIRLKGRLDAHWAAWFDGLTVSQESDSTTVISGPIADQAALHGVLQRVRDLGLPLVSVSRIEHDRPPAPGIETGYIPPSAHHPRKETDMATNARTDTTKRVPMDSIRKTAFVAGVLYLITFISSIPAVFLLGPVLTNPNYITSAGADTQVTLGAMLDLINAIAAIGTAVALFSIVRRQHEGLALGFVMSRMFEAAVIVTGIVSILAIVTLRQAGAASGDAATLVPVGRGLVAVRDWTFLLGPGTAGVNALLLGTLMYRSGLVPRLIPAMGLIGAPIYLSSQIGIIFGINHVETLWSAVGLVPIFFWELFLGLWMTFKGFNRSAPILAGMVGASTRADGPATATSSRDSDAAGAA